MLLFCSLLVWNNSNEQNVLKRKVPNELPDEWTYWSSKIRHKKRELKGLIKLVLSFLSFKASKYLKIKFFFFWQAKLSLMTHCS